MPLRNVATTFTIEQQRLEINALAGDVNNIATGVTNVGTAATANALAAGATGAGGDKIFWENGQTVTTDYTITNNYNAGTWGPVTINSGVTVTGGTGEYWTIM